jgi:hypothetical protein
MVAGATEVVRFQGIPIHSSVSDGDEIALLPFRSMTRDRLAPSADAARLQVSGWGFSPDNDLLLTVRDSRGMQVDATLRYLAGRDVFDHFIATEGRRYDRARDSRFILWTPCLRDCSLVIIARGQDRVLGTLPLAGGAQSIATPELRVHVEIMNANLGALTAYPVDAFKLRILGAVVRLYGWIGPILAGILIVGVVGTPVALALGARVPLMVPLLMLVVAFLGRVGLIAVVDSTSFPSRTAHYLGPAHALFLLAGLVACLEVGRVLSAMRRREDAPSAPSRLRSVRKFWLPTSLSTVAVLLVLLAGWYVWFSRGPSVRDPKATFCCKDMNGDGRADILWRQSSGAVAVWLVSGTSVVGTGVLSAAAPADWTIAGVADFNGDGKADVLWRQPSGALGVWLLDGTKVIGTGVLPSEAPAGWTIAGVGDFNGDGRADILWRQASGAVAVWLLDGTRIIGTGVLPGEAQAGWTVVGVGDFNGDGKADILWRQVSGSVAVWLLNGTNLIGTGVPGAAPDWTIVGVGDFNGDGKADILWRQSSGAVAVWLLNGTNLIGTGVLAGGALTDSSIVGVGDFNGDGKADILWRQSSGAVAVWLIDGTTVVGTGLLPGQVPREWLVQ